MSTAPRAIDSLTSIRGIAALWVYLYHCHFLAAGGDGFMKFRQLGYFGVDVFFILSGFILTYVHLSEFSTRDDARANTSRFLMLRLARIYPLHLATLLMIVALQFSGRIAPGPGDNAWTFVQNLLLVQAWSGPHLSWNIIAWSISVEWMLYLVFPFLCWLLLARLKDALGNGLLLALAFSLIAVYSYAVDMNFSSMHEPGYSLPRGLLDFVIGATLHNLFRLGVFPRARWDLIALLSLLGFAGVILYAAYWPPQRYFALDVVFVALSALLIFSLAHAQGFMARVFANPVLMHLGKVSYSMYMLHLIYLMTVTGLQLAIFRDLKFLSWQYLLLTTGLVAASTLSYLLIEKPGRRWVRAAMLPEAGPSRLWPAHATALGFAALAAIMVAWPLARQPAAPLVAVAQSANTAPSRPAGPGLPADMLDAAQKGDPVAQYNVAVQFYVGQSVGRDYARAFEWFEKSAQGRFPPAYYSLGNLLANGMGVAKDQAAATGWYRKAADRGNADGQLAMAIRLTAGTGIDPNPAEAYFWVVLSAMGGNPTAQRLRTEWAAKLQEAARSEIEGRAKSWKPAE